MSPVPIISLTFAEATPSLAIEPAKVSEAALAEPLNVTARSSVTFLNDLVFKSALDMPTPNLLNAVLLPKKALLKALVTEVKSLPVEALMSRAMPSSL